MQSISEHPITFIMRMQKEHWRVERMSYVKNHSPLIWLNWMTWLLLRRNKTNCWWSKLRGPFWGLSWCKGLYGLDSILLDSNSRNSCSAGNLERLSDSRPTSLCRVILKVSLAYWTEAYWAYDRLGTWTSNVEPRIGGWIPARYVSLSPTCRIPAGWGHGIGASDWYRPESC